MVKVMTVASRSGSWFGFQVWFGFAGAGGRCFQELGEGRWLIWLPSAELVDHDHVVGAMAQIVREGRDVGLSHLTHVDVP
jgi:hypothetical protein